MKFEKISNEKFAAFKNAEVVYAQSIYGGYRGETNTTNQYDQEKSGGKVDYTNKINNPPTRNDGFADN
jgi:hypothetical protein